MNVSAIKSFLSSIGIDHTDALKRLEYFSNDDPNRQIYVIDKHCIVKAYSSKAFVNYNIEWLTSEVAYKAKVPTPPCLGHFQNEQEAYVAYEYCDTKALNEVYRELSLKEYCTLCHDLGKAMNTLHAIAAPGWPNLQMYESVSPNSLLNTKTRLSKASDILHSSIDLLGLSITAVDNLKSYILKVKAEVFSDENCLCHGDIHNENVLYELQEGKSNIRLIDWETAFIGPPVLDMVHPFLNIIGESFTGRRLSNATDNSNAGLLLDSFENGYQKTVNWKVVAALGCLWYCETALKADEEGKTTLRDFFIRTALGGLSAAGFSIN